MCCVDPNHLYVGENVLSLNSVEEVEVLSNGIMGFEHTYNLIGGFSEWTGDTALISEN